MNKQLFQKYSMADADVELLSSIFTRRLSRKEVEDVENAISKLSHEQYKEIVNLVLQKAKEKNYALNHSEAGRGAIGFANKIGRFFKNIWFSYKYTDKAILAEGDSWFEHLFVEEILDHLKQIVDIPIYSIAYGGDWIGNYIQEQTYLKELKSKNYPYFLLSGGGNDMVGGKRVSTMIKPRNTVTSTEIDPSFRSEVMPSLIVNFGQEKAESIGLGKNFVNDNFWILRNIFLFEYLLIIRSIESVERLSHVKIIVQGYDFGIPNNDKPNLFRKLLGHGKWLYEPIVKMGYTDPKEQRAIVDYMIHEFNQVLDYISTHKKQVYYIDCRGVATEKDWNDELHLTSAAYKKIAQAYKRCIESTNALQKKFLAR